jgi:hypothetical protein
MRLIEALDAAACLQAGRQQNDGFNGAVVIVMVSPSWALQWQLVLICFPQSKSSSFMHPIICFYAWLTVTTCDGVAEVARWQAWLLATVVSFALFQIDVVDICQAAR